MRVVLLLSKHNAGAELALNNILRNEEIDVVGVVRSDNSFFNRRYWKYLFYGIRRWGFFYAFLVGLFYNLHFIGLFLGGLLWWRRKKKWLSADALIQKHGLLVHDTSNINSPESLRVIASWDPDVMVSLYFDQILKKEAIALSKVRILNMHPGPLPRYKGLWPCFWQLYNKDRFAAVTVHELSEKIDSGDIYAFRKYPIDQKETKFTLMLKSAGHGSQLLVEILQKIKKGIHLTPLPIKGKSKYYSLPSRRQIERFFCNKKRLFSLSQVVDDVDRLAL